MKIDNNALNLTPSLSQADQVNQASVKGNHGHRKASAGGDQVQLSGLASLIASSSVTDPAKIQQLQASYEAGTYNVSPQKIAEGMMSYMQG